MKARLVVGQGRLLKRFDPYSAVLAAALSVASAAVVLVVSVIDHVASYPPAPSQTFLVRVQGTCVCNKTTKNERQREDILTLVVEYATSNLTKSASSFAVAIWEQGETRNTSSRRMP